MHDFQLKTFIYVFLLSGTRLGYYLYIEASKAQSGDNARLLSATFQPAKPNDRCAMRFYYHMYGEEIANLVVFQKLSADSRSQMKPLWHTSGVWVYLLASFATFSVE